MQISKLEIYKKFLEYIKFRKMLSHNTIRNYEVDLLQFLIFIIKFHNIEYDNNDEGFEKKLLNILSHLSNQEIREWIINKKELNILNRSINRSISVIKLFYKLLLETFQIDNQNILNLNILKFEKSLPKAINIEKILLVIEEVGNFDNQIHRKNNWEKLRNKLIFSLMFFSGLRISEALLLKTTDIIDEKFIKIIGKGNKERIVPLLDKYYIILKEYYNSIPQEIRNKNKFNYFFISKKSSVVSVRYIEKICKNVREKLNLPDYFTPHSLRHSCATNLLENNINIRLIQKLLGHANLSATQIYTKIQRKKIMDKLKKVDW